MRSSCCLVLAAAVLAAVLLPGPVIADAKIPTRDIANARDNPLLRRYDGSFIVDYRKGHSTSSNCRPAR